MAKVRPCTFRSLCAGAYYTCGTPMIFHHSYCSNFKPRLLQSSPKPNIIHTLHNLRRVSSTKLHYCPHNYHLMPLVLHSRVAFLPSTNNISGYRAYSSDSGKKIGSFPEKAMSTSVGESSVNNTDVVGNNWIDQLKHAYQSSAEAFIDFERKVEEVSNEIIYPHVQKLIDSHPYLKNIIFPVGGTITATILTWLVMPRLLRKLHTYSVRGSALLLYGKSTQEQISYERSFWGALEDPVRYLITFMAFSQLGVMIAPTSFASHYVTQAWRVAFVLSFVWFLHRWKTNVFARSLAASNMLPLDRERLIALERLSSVGLLILGFMASAEACGMAVQSVLTVGGIGGVATAFAAKDILGNVLSGFSVQFSRPFSIGDNIKAGSIEGQVVEMGLTTTSLLNSEKFPVIVPNSLFSSQVIVNKSRAQWRTIMTKIPLRIDDIEKVPQISEDIKSMLKSNEKVFLGKEAPYCFLSRIENSYVEFTIGCNLRQMSKDEFYSMEQDILLQSARIIKKHGAELGSTFQDMGNH